MLKDITPYIGFFKQSFSGISVISILRIIIQLSQKRDSPCSHRKLPSMNIKVRDASVIRDVPITLILLRITMLTVLIMCDRTLALKGLLGDRKRKAIRIFEKIFFRMATMTSPLTITLAGASSLSLTRSLLSCVDNVNKQTCFGRQILKVQTFINLKLQISCEQQLKNQVSKLRESNRSVF